MPVSRSTRHYAVFAGEGELARMHANAPQRRNEVSREHIARGLAGLPDQVTVDVRSHPSLDWELILEADGHRHRHAGETVCAIDAVVPEGNRMSPELLAAVHANMARQLTDYRELGSDVRVSFADYWNPAEATNPLFGDRRAALRLMAVDRLKQRQPALGERVNVVVVDQGVDKALVQRLGGSFAGGWTRPDAHKPGETKGGHGAMLVRNVLSVAQRASIFDCPLVSNEVGNIRAFLSQIHAAYSHMLGGIAHLRRHDPAKWGGPWVFLNAWATFDRGSEFPAGDYTNNPNHPFNRIIERTVNSGFDVVFAAGNCGQFDPDLECGSCDQGPGHSILGANSHPKVLTIGAVRADAMWLGYSSQGPGQPRLSRYKPDLCAASQFRETDDAYTGNTGTSAASALATGVVAALRSRWDATAFSPDELKMLLTMTARRNDGQAWNGRLGNGILDAAAAFDAATRRNP